MSKYSTIPECYLLELVCGWILELAEPHRGAHSKTCIKWLREFRFESVNELHSLCYWVKGHCVASVVQVHADTSSSWCAGKISIDFVVPSGVPCVRAEQAPGLVVVSQQTVGVLALATNAPISHPDWKLPTPFRLPVESETTQRLFAQHLGKAVKALRVIRVGLDSFFPCDSLVFFWQDQLFVNCVWVKRQPAGI